MRTDTRNRRRIGLALLLAGSLALPVAPAAAAPQETIGQYLKQGHAQNDKKPGKARQQERKAQQQAQKAHGQARKAQARAHQARAQSAQSQAKAHRAEARAQANRAQARAAEARAAEARARARQVQVHRQVEIHRQVTQRQVSRQTARWHAQRINRRASWVATNGRPVYRNPGRTVSRVFAVDGTLLDDGYQCTPLRDDQGHIYILEGRVDGLAYGDHVRLVARDAPYSSCGLEGRPVVVTRVARVWADSHHRSAYYQANVDGSFEVFLRWRSGDRWSRQPRFSGYDDLDDYAAADYDYWADGW